MWEHFVTDVVIPAFKEIKAELESQDGTSGTIEPAINGEHWVRLTWAVAPSPSLIARFPPSAKGPVSPTIVLAYTVGSDVPSGGRGAWSETRVPRRDAPDGMNVFREELGDYRNLTKDAIKSSFLANYRQHVLG